MATLRRDDGLQFVIQSYRELLNLDRSSVLKRKVRELAKKHGTNVRIFRQNEHRLEAVFSRDPGFLLGETLWFLLDKPANLVYCEDLPERHQVLLIVVKDGIVFIDTRMSYAHLIDELTALSISDKKYDIYVYGKVPLVETDTSGKFAFAPEYVNSFKVLDAPLSAKLSVYEEAQLQPLELALASPYLGKSKVMPIVIIGAIIIAIFVAWRVFKAAPKMKLTPLKLMRMAPKASPYQQYYQTLAKPLPQKQMIEFILTAQLPNDLPGWKISRVAYANNNYILYLTAAGGSVTQVQSWAKLNGVAITLQPQGIKLTIPSMLVKRSQVTEIYPLQQVLGILIDDVNRILTGKNVVFSSVTNYNRYKEVTVTINFSKIYPGVLILIGQELSKLPVAISAISVTPENSLFSGNITLKVLGD